MSRLPPDGRPSRWEIVGAWLGVWTPPQGAEIPPVPWRRLGIAGAVTAIALTGAGLAIAPRIDREKERARETERRESARREASEARRLREAGRLDRGSITPPAGGHRLSPPQRRAARRRLVEALEASIARDARARAREGELKGPVRAARCTIEPPSQRFLERDLSTRAATYDCLAIRRADPEGRFLVGHPFRARVDYRRFRYSWRLVCLPPGEGALRLAC